MNYHRMSHIQCSLLKSLILKHHHSNIEFFPNISWLKIVGIKTFCFGYAICTLSLLIALICRPTLQWFPVVQYKSCWGQGMLCRICISNSGVPCSIYVCSPHQYWCQWHLIWALIVFRSRLLLCWIQSIQQCICTPSLQLAGGLHLV